MCGIAGAFGPNARQLAQAVRDATELLRHRGPDGSGFRAFDGAVLGMRRLAIIDLETGDQPIANERETVHVVVNGEIYNYVELAEAQRRAGHQFRSRSDVETIVHAYEDHGDAFAAQLRGMFAVALVDLERGALILARDPFGQKPLYYAELPGGGVAFASELKAMAPLLAAAGIGRTIDEQAIYDYLSLNFVPQPATIYREVRSVLPGEVLAVTMHGVQRHRYWQPRIAPDETMTYEDALDSVRAGVSESVRLCLRSDVPLGAFLSGGLDSTIVVTEAVRHGAGDLMTFAVAMDDAALDESSVAQRTAERLGVANTVVPVRFDPIADLQAVVKAYGQPFGDSSAIATYAVSRATAGSRKVVLTGDGGDEVFGGYRRHLAAYAASRLPAGATRAAARLAAPITRRIASTGARRSRAGLLARWAQGLALNGGERYLKWTQDRLRDSDKRAFVRSKGRPTERIVEEAFGGASTLVDQQFMADVLLTLPGDMLVKMDVATSAWSLEARAPLLDHALAERVFQIPRRYLFQGRRTKALLRDAFASDLSHEVATGAKRGFEIPVAKWLATEWQPLIQELVLDSSAELRKHVDADLISRVFSGEAFQDRNVNSLRYGLLVLELWLRGEASR